VTELTLAALAGLDGTAIAHTVVRPIAVQADLSLGESFALTTSVTGGGGGDCNLGGALIYEVVD
jgi:hypothetical protein